MRRLLLGAALLLAAAAWHVADRGPAGGDALRDAVLDLDARVALRPQRACEPRVASSVAIAAGRAPRVDAAGHALWYEAPGPDGRRQIQRFDRATSRSACLTCAEPGNNRRPAPHPAGRAVVFDTDRFASALRPFDRELMVLAADDGALRASRRLTWDAAADTHALYDPSGLGVAWSRRTLVGRVLRAPIRLGHGGVALGEAETLARGGFAALAPSAWSADARALVLVGGFSFARWIESVDFARGAQALPTASAFDGSVAFSADGSARVRAERTAAGARVLLATSPDSEREIAMGALATWGEPTGIALAPDADAFALAQRRGAEERIVWVRLACAGVE